MSPYTPKTLAMLKMEKNFIAHLQKKYPRKPYLHCDIDFLLKRLSQEVLELIEAWEKNDFENCKQECADISNIVDFIFEALSL